MTSYIIGTAYFLLTLEILMIIASFLYARRERKTERPNYTPKAVIIAPHYGWDSQTEKNVKCLLNQDYAGNYEVFFVTHAKGVSEHDVSYAHLLDIAEAHPRARALLAPNIVDNSLPRSQKVQNLITAIATLSDDVEVIAFVDADVTIQKDWLTLLVEPLQDKNIGATVGARFYFPHTPNAPSLVESIWVNLQISLQGDHSLTMVWGGSNAIRREFLKEGNILQRWQNAAIEDLNLTHAVRDCKLKVHFVPDCIAITHVENRTWKQIFEFTNRQLIMTFRMELLAQWALCLIICVPKALILFGALPFMIFHFHQLYPLLFIPFIEIQSYRLSSLNLPRWLREQPQMRENIRMTSFVTPISQSLAGLNTLYALFQKQIVWGGVRYEILSATKCRVLGRVTDEQEE